MIPKVYDELRVAYEKLEEVLFRLHVPLPVQALEVPDAQLTWQRHHGKWRIFFGTKPWIECSLQERIEFADKLHFLVEAMFGSTTDTVAKVRSAVDIVEKLAEDTLVRLNKDFPNADCRTGPE